MTSHAPVTVGSYDIVEPLGRGAMATVSVAVHRALQRRVALKRLDLDSSAPDAAARFIRESRIAASLQHPHIVTVHDFFEHDGVPYIAMELVPGGSLRGRIGDITPAQAIGVTADVLDALTYTEARRIVHRDIKPDNVLVGADGRVKLADFGIARAIDGLTNRLTMADMAVGTPTYMAPEQATASPVGPATDLYAVGMMLFHLLAGRAAFEDESPMGLLFRHVHELAPRLDAVDPSVDRELADWVDWLVQKEPQERPRSADEAWRSLEPIAARLIGPRWRDDAALAQSPAQERVGQPPSPVAQPVAASPRGEELTRAPASEAADAAPTPPNRDRRRTLLTVPVVLAVLVLAGVTAGVLAPRIAAAIALLGATAAAVVLVTARRDGEPDDGPIRPGDWLS